MATTNFFHALGGAVGAAVLGAVFVARTRAVGDARSIALGSAARGDVIAGVQTVFAIAAPIALLALVVVLGLKEVPLGRAVASRAAASGRPRGAPHPARR